MPDDTNPYWVPVAEREDADPVKPRPHASDKDAIELAGPGDGVQPIPDFAERPA